MNSAVGTTSGPLSLRAIATASSANATASSGRFCSTRTPDKPASIASSVAATALLFGVKAGEGLRRLGLALSASDVDCIAHLYRVVAARVGVAAPLQAADFAAGCDLFSLLTAMHGRPDDDSVRLTDALMRAPLLRADSAAGLVAARVASWWMRGLSGGLVGEAADGLGLPAGRRRTAVLRWVAQRVRTPLPGQQRAIETFVLRTQSGAPPRPAFRARRASV